MLPTLLRRTCRRRLFTSTDRATLRAVISASPSALELTHFALGHGREILREDLSLCLLLIKRLVSMASWESGAHRNPAAADTSAHGLTSPSAELSKILFENWLPSHFRAVSPSDVSIAAITTTLHAAAAFQALSPGLITAIEPIIALRAGDLTGDDVLLILRALHALRYTNARRIDTAQLRLHPSEAHPHAPLLSHLAGAAAHLMRRSAARSEGAAVGSLSWKGGVGATLLRLGRRRQQRLGGVSATRSGPLTYSDVADLAAAGLVEWSEGGQGGVGDGDADCKVHDGVGVDERDAACDAPTGGALELRRRPRQKARRGGGRPRSKSKGGVVWRDATVEAELLQQAVDGEVEDLLVEIEVDEEVGEGGVPLSSLLDGGRERAVSGTHVGGSGADDVCENDFRRLRAIACGDDDGGVGDGGEVGRSGKTSGGVPPKKTVVVSLRSLMKTLRRGTDAAQRAAAGETERLRDIADGPAVGPLEMVTDEMRSADVVRGWKGDSRATLGVTPAHVTRPALSPAQRGGDGEYTPAEEGDADVDALLNRFSSEYTQWAGLPLRNAVDVMYVLRKAQYLDISAVVAFSRAVDAAVVEGLSVAGVEGVIDGVGVGGAHATRDVGDRTTAVASRTAPSTPSTALTVSAAASLAEEIVGGTHARVGKTIEGVGKGADGRIQNYAEGCVSVRKSPTKRKSRSRKSGQTARAGSGAVRGPSHDHLDANAWHGGLLIPSSPLASLSPRRFVELVLTVAEFDCCSPFTRAALLRLIPHAISKTTARARCEARVRAVVKAAGGVGDEFADELTPEVDDVSARGGEGSEVDAEVHREEGSDPSALTVGDDEDDANLNAAEVVCSPLPSMPAVSGVAEAEAEVDEETDAGCVIGMSDVCGNDPLGDEIVNTSRLIQLVSAIGVMRWQRGEGGSAPFGIRSPAESAANCSDDAVGEYAAGGVNVSGTSAAVTSGNDTTTVGGVCYSTAMETAAANAAARAIFTQLQGVESVEDAVEADKHRLEGYICRIILAPKNEAFLLRIARQIGPHAHLPRRTFLLRAETRYADGLAEALLATATARDAELVGPGDQARVMDYTGYDLHAKRSLDTPTRSLETALYDACVLLEGVVGRRDEHGIGVHRTPTLGSGVSDRSTSAKSAANIPSATVDGDPGEGSGAEKWEDVKISEQLDGAVSLKTSQGSPATSSPTTDDGAPCLLPLRLFARCEEQSRVGFDSWWGVLDNALTHTRGAYRLRHVVRPLGSVLRTGQMFITPKTVAARLLASVHATSLSHAVAPYYSGSSPPKPPPPPLRLAPSVVDQVVGTALPHSGTKAKIRRARKGGVGRVRKSDRSSAHVAGTPTDMSERRGESSEACTDNLPSAAPTRPLLKRKSVRKGAGGVADFFGLGRYLVLRTRGRAVCLEVFDDWGTLRTARADCDFDDALMGRATARARHAAASLGVPVAVITTPRYRQLMRWTQRQFAQRLRGVGKATARIGDAAGVTAAAAAIVQHAAKVACAEADSMHNAIGSHAVEIEKPCAPQPLASRSKRRRAPPSVNDILVGLLRGPSKASKGLRRRGSPRSVGTSSLLPSGAPEGFGPVRDARAGAVASIDGGRGDASTKSGLLSTTGVAVLPALTAELQRLTALRLVPNVAAYAVGVDRELFARESVAKGSETIDDEAVAATPSVEARRAFAQLAIAPGVGIGHVAAQLDAPARLLGKTYTSGGATRGFLRDAGIGARKGLHSRMGGGASAVAAAE